MEPTDATDLTGKLLVSTPLIGSGVFHRSVILVLVHGPEGAQGVVLNRPLSADIDAVLPGWQEHVTTPRTLFQGGPVELDSAVGLVGVPGDDHDVLGIKRMFRGVGLVDLDAPPLLVMPEVAGLRIFAGYAGWSPGQLEGELAEGSWFVVEAEARDPFTPEPDALWTEVLRRQGPPLAWVATFPANPDFN